MSKPDLVCPMPEEGDPALFKHCILDNLGGNLSVHRRLKTALTKAGFKVTRVRKHELHNLWEIRLTRSAAMLADTDIRIRRRIGNALKSEVMYSKREGMVVSFNGRRVICGFNSKFGGVGFI